MRNVEGRVGADSLMQMFSLGMVFFYSLCVSLSVFVVHLRKYEEKTRVGEQHYVTV